MNIHRIFKFWTAAALAAILLHALIAQASTAYAMPHVDNPGGAAAKAADCSALTAGASLAAVDIPARRAEYAALDKLADCLAVAGVKITIPITGRAASSFDLFMAVKDRQAELLDRSASAPTASGYRDPGFMKFKDRQAERMAP